jgi:hypothetical protein
MNIWNGQELVVIHPPQLKNYARAGVYICCMSGAGHNHGGPSDPCGYHLWAYVGPDPIPPLNALLHMIQRDVPHVNGNGAHAF